MIWLIPAVLLAAPPEPARTPPRMPPEVAAAMTLPPPIDVEEWNYPGMHRTVGGHGRVSHVLEIRENAHWAARTEDDFEKDDLANLQGAWYAVDYESSEEGERAFPATPNNPPDLVIEGNRLVLHGQPLGRVSVDAAQRPKAMDWDVDRRARDGGLNRGIYKLEGGRLTICLARPGVPRPKEFTAPKGSGRQVTIYERRRP